MADIGYYLIEENGGWRYVIDSERSASFSSRQEAEDAARSAAMRRSEREDQLEEGLEDTFPASDPVSVTRPR
ncbi:hypothetical protein [Oricola sp.]|uniref:hypothetical protein n=1 Tax=Oricola sp. TaxID=1979950 RepID=UPI0035184833